MELRHLRYLVAVAEELNFSRAARRLHLSQPPLSRQIRDLEAELGVTLFERAASKVRLTPAGDYVYHEAKRLLEQSEQLIQQARRVAAETQHELQIGYIANVHGRLVIDAATRFRKTHPSVVVRVSDLSTADQVERLANGKLDLGFVGFADGPREQGLQVECIGTTQAIVALAQDHPLARHKTQPLRRFQSESFVTIQEDSFPGARDLLMKFCAEAGFRPRIVHEAGQPIDVLNLVAMGAGVALVPERMRQSPHPGIVFCRLREPIPQIDSFVAWRAADTSALLRDFVATAKQSYVRLARHPAPDRSGT